MMIEKENTEPKKSLAQDAEEAAAEAETEVGLEAETVEEAVEAEKEADPEVKNVEEERATVPEVTVIVAETREANQVQTAETK